MNQKWNQQLLAQGTLWHESQALFGERETQLISSRGGIQQPVINFSQKMKPGKRLSPLGMATK